MCVSGLGLLGLHKLSAFCVRLGGSSRAVVLHLALCPYPLLGAILGGSWVVTS